MSTTPNMSLIVPDVGTSGPAYATQINTAMDVIDGHDHTPGKGARIPPSGLNINADLPFNGNDAISLRSTRYVAQAAVLATSDDRNCVSSVNGNLYWNNASGTAVQITSGAGLNFASLGTIGGDYGAAGVTASAVYTSILQSFSWLQAASTFAKMGMGDLSIYSTTAGTQAVTLKADALTAAYNYTFPVAAPAANTFMRMALGGQGTFVAVNGTANQITVTQNTSDMTLSIPSNAILPGNVSATGSITTTVGFAGPGMVPIGAIMAIGDAGAWALPASGAIKDGYALCDGQVKPVGSAAGLAANLPNLTDDRFLNGSTAPGGTGGSASKTTTGIAASFNKTELNSNQNAHSHGMDHRHLWGSYTYVADNNYRYSTFNSNNSTLDFLLQSGRTGGTDPNTAPFNDPRIFWGQAGTSSFSFYTQNSVETSPNTGGRTSTDNSSVSWASATVSTTVTQGTIADIRPKYFNVVYLMRVA